MEEIKTPVFFKEKESEKNFGISQTGKQVEETAQEKNSFFQRTLDGILTVLLSLLFFGLPLWFTGLSYQGGVFEKQLFFSFVVLLAVVVWVVQGMIKGVFRVRKTALDMPLLALVLVYGISAIISVDMWRSLFGFFGDPSRGLFSLVAMVLFWYVFSTHFTRKRFSWMLGSLVLSGSLVVLWMMGHSFSWGFLPQWTERLFLYNPFATSTSSMAFLSGFLYIVVSAIFYLAEYREKGRFLFWLSRGGIILLFGILGFNLFLILALTGYVSWISLIIGSGLMVVFVLARFIRPMRSLVWIPMVLFVALFTIFISGNNRMVKDGFPAEISPDNRLSWSILKEAFSHDPIFGSGPGTYAYNFSLYRPLEFNENILSSVRFSLGSGMVWEVATTMGIAGAVMFGVLLLTVMGAGFYLIFVSRSYNIVGSVSLWLAGCILLVASLLVSVNGAFFLVSVMVWSLAFAILLEECRAEKEYREIALRVSPKYALTFSFLTLVVSAGAIYIFVFLGKVYVADIMAGRILRSEKVTEDTITAIQSALRLNPYEARYWIRMGQEYVMLANQEALHSDGGDREKIKTWLEAAVLSASEGDKRSRNDVSAKEMIAQIYENATLFVPDGIDSVEKQYALARDLEPTNPAYVLKIAQIRLTQARSVENPDERRARLEEVRRIAQQASDMKKQYAPALYLLSLIENEIGEKDTAITLMESAARADHKSVEIYFELARLYRERGEENDLAQAEIILKDVLELKNTDPNVHFQLALVYEEMNKLQDALAQYREVLKLLPMESSDAVKTRIETMIKNLESGKKNIDMKDATLEQSSDIEGNVVNKQ